MVMVENMVEIHGIQQPDSLLSPNQQEQHQE